VGVEKEMFFWYHDKVTLRKGLLVTLRNDVKWAAEGG
jgi:hypothetical protein